MKVYNGKTIIIIIDFLIFINVHNTFRNIEFYPDAFRTLMSLIPFTNVQEFVCIQTSDASCVLYSSMVRAHFATDEGVIPKMFANNKK